MGNTFSYKGLHLNVFITYAAGNKVRLDPAFSTGYSDLTAMPKEFQNRWVVPGDENHTDIPAIADYRQHDPILNADNPFSTGFNSMNVWGPLMGRKFYAGLRFNLY